MKAMWMFFAAVLAVSVLAGAGCGKKAPEVVKPGAGGGSDMDEVVLRIDNTTFTRAQVAQELAKFERQFPEGASEEVLNQMRTRALARVLDSMVTRELVRAEMVRQNAIVTAGEVTAAKEQLFGNLQNEDAMAIMLAENNMTMEQLEDSLKLDIFRNRILADKVAAATNAVTEETAREFYEGHPDLFTRPAGRQVSHILVRVAKDASEEEVAAARKKIDRVREALMNGADFAQLARETSDCVSASRGGDLGVVPRGREAQEFEDAVYGQEIGALGEVVRSPVGFHVIKVTGEVAEEEASFDDVKDVIINRLRSEAHRRLGQEFIQELRDKAEIRFEGALASLNAPAPGEEGEPAEEAPADAAEPPAEDAPAAEADGE